MNHNRRNFLAMIGSIPLVGDLLKPLINEKIEEPIIKEPVNISCKEWSVPISNQYMIEIHASATINNSCKAIVSLEPGDNITFTVGDGGKAND